MSTDLNSRNLSALSVPFSFLLVQVDYSVARCGEGSNGLGVYNFCKYYFILYL